MKNLKRWIYRSLGPWLLYPTWHFLHTIFGAYLSKPHTRVCAVIKNPKGEILAVQHTGHENCNSLPGGSLSLKWSFQAWEHLQQELREELGLIVHRYKKTKTTELKSLPWHWVGYRRLIIYTIHLEKEPDIQISHELESIAWLKEDKLREVGDFYTKETLRNL